MISNLSNDLEMAIQSDLSLEGIVALLRSYKAHGVTRQEVYKLLERLRETARDEQAEDRILEVADFVAGFCSPHMKVWDN